MELLEGLQGMKVKASTWSVARSSTGREELLQPSNVTGRKMCPCQYDAGDVVEIFNPVGRLGIERHHIGVVADPNMVARRFLR